MLCDTQCNAGNSSLADNILSKNFKEIAPIFGSKIDGPDKFKSTIDGLFSVRSLLLLCARGASCHAGSVGTALYNCKLLHVKTLAYPTPVSQGL